jgi:uncharacterized UPF0160 family protein
METNNKKLITHDGSFHADDIFAAAALSLMLQNKGENFEIIRTRNRELVSKGDYVFDVGGIYDEKTNKFDHHQADFKEKRKNGICYSSFGLVWEKYGLELSGSGKIMNIVEKHLVAPIDAFDCGFDLVENKYDISPYFIEHFFLAMTPTWTEKNISNDEMFFKCVKVAGEILLREIIHARDSVLAEELVISIYNDSKDRRIIVLDKNYPYEDTLNNFPEPLFVIYPRASDNSWGVKAVKEDPKTFKNRKDFPKNWAGLLDKELQKITGVSDAVFCHKGLFMAVAKSKEGAIKLAELALNLS